jgi:hypothetical protein
MTLITITFGLLITSQPIIAARLEGITLSGTTVNKTSMLTFGKTTTISQVPIAGIVSVPSPEITREIGDIGSFSAVLLPITEISAPLSMM